MVQLYVQILLNEVHIHVCVPFSAVVFDPVAASNFCISIMFLLFDGAVCMCVGGGLIYEGFSIGNIIRKKCNIGRNARGWDRTRLAGQIHAAFHQKLSCTGNQDFLKIHYPCVK